MVITKTFQTWLKLENIHFSILALRWQLKQQLATVLAYVKSLHRLKQYRQHNSCRRKNIKYERKTLVIAHVHNKCRAVWIQRFRFGCWPTALLNNRTTTAQRRGQDLWRWEVVAMLVHGLLSIGNVNHRNSARWVAIETLVKIQRFKR